MRAVAVNNHINEGFLLGDWHVQPLRGQVTGRDESRYLSPKAAGVLMCLAAQPGEIVSRHQLLESVWGTGRGSQEALSHAVSALRSAIDDHRENPQFIQTVPRRGYRLLVTPQPVSETVSPAADVPPEPAAGGAGFFGELKRRGVVQTGLTYLVLGWLLLQVADVVFDQLLLPRRLGTFVTVLIIAGFPMALVLAWFIDIVEGRAVLHRPDPQDVSTNTVRRGYTAILGALLLAAAGVYSYDYFIGLPGTGELDTTVAAGEISLDTPVEPNGIAILPFHNIDGSDTTRIFAEGLAEDLTDRLAKVPSLRVSSRNDSVLLPTSVASEEVRRRLRVSYYLEGSVRLLDDRMRVVIQLIDSANGFHLLSRSFDFDRREFFAIQDEITKQTVAALRPQLPPDTRVVPDAVTANENLDAYVLYRRGMDALHRPETADSIKAALGWFGRALAADPEYAAAHAGKCIAYVTGFDVVADRGYIARAEESCAAALARNPNLDIVYVALGELYERTGQYSDAEDAYQRALSIDPHNVTALTGLASIYHRNQQTELAEQKYREAIGLQPGNWRTYDALGTFLYRIGRYREAAENYRKVLSVDPENRQGYGNLGAALMMSGDFAEAVPAFMRSIEIEPQTVAYSNLGMMYYYLGQLDESVAAHEKAAALAPNDHLTWSNLGDALSFTDDTDRAKAAFQRAEKLAEDKLAVNASDADTLIELAWIKAMLGKSDEALELIGPAKRIKPGDPYIHFISGLVLVKAGKTALAYDDLEAAVEMGFPAVMLAAEPHLRSLKGDPRFAALTGPRTGN